MQWNDKGKALYVFKNIFIFLQVPALFPPNIIYKIWDFCLETGIFCQGENLNYFLKLCMSKESHLIIPGDFHMIQKDLHVAQRKV